MPRRRSGCFRSGGIFPALPFRGKSATNVTYYLQRRTNLNVASPFSSFKSNIVGQAGTTTNKDTNVNGSGPFFYRVGVQ